jgi:hypothetical protein
MRIIKLAWVGTRTDNAEPTVAFFRATATTFRSG